jgi:hypothetical protein
VTKTRGPEINRSPESGIPLEGKSGPTLDRGGIFPNNYPPNSPIFGIKVWRIYLMKSLLFD